MKEARTGSQRVVRPGARKRRPPLSCIQCYGRKLKCGREFPACSRCARGGKADQCTYRYDTARTLSTDDGIVEGPSRDSENNRSIVSPARVAPEETSRSIASRYNTNMTHWKGQGTLTNFYGYTYHLNFYQQFPGLKDYNRRTKLGNPMINTLRDEIFPQLNDDFQYRSPATGSITERSLCDLIPAKHVADSLIQTFVDRFEKTHRVLDVPAFLLAYNRHWDSPFSTHPSFLVQVILVMAAAASICPELCIETMTHKTAHAYAVSWVDAAEAWLGYSVNVNAQCSNFLANHCLLLIAKRSNCIQESSLWTSAGTLVRLAMAAGYHREPSPTAQISPYHREMRRRLWTTIVELELQCSVERGMPPSVKFSDFNAESPLHINDNQLQESMKDSVLQAPITTWTDASFQVLLRRSLNARLDICSFLNGNSEHDEHFEKIPVLGQQLSSALCEIPAWNNPPAGPREQQMTMYVKGLLRVYIQQYMILLHIPSSLQTSQSYHSAICRRMKLDSAAIIINQYTRLIEARILAPVGCKIGLVLAAINICHEIYMSCKIHGETSTMLSALSQFTELFIVIVEGALDILEKQVTTTLHGLNEYYLVAMIIGFVKSKLSPQDATSVGQEAADRVIRVSRLVKAGITGITPATMQKSSVESTRRETGENVQSVHDEMNELLSAMVPEELQFMNDDFDFDLFLN